MNNPAYIYNKLKIENLESNKYYTFYKNDNTNFYAQFIIIIETTLIVKNYRTDDEYDENSTRSMPVDWIKYIEATDIISFVI
jgi:hypothetical protein